MQGMPEWSAADSGRLEGDFYGIPVFNKDVRPLARFTAFRPHGRQCYASAVAESLDVPIVPTLEVSQALRNAS